MRILSSICAARNVLALLVAIGPSWTAAARVLQESTATRPATTAPATTAPASVAPSGIRGSDPAVFAPRDALAFVGVGDLEKFIGDFAKSGVGTIHTDRRAAADLPDVKEMQDLYDDYRGRIARAIGVEPAQMKWPFGGACAAFVYRMKGEAGGGELFLGYGLTLGVRDAATARDYYTKLTANLKTIAAMSDSATSGAYRIDFFRLSLSEPAEEEIDDEFEEPTLTDVSAMVAELAGWQSVAVCLREDRLFAGDSIETVRAMLKREPSGSLAATRDYAAIDRVFDTPGGLRLAFDLPQALRIAREFEPEGTKELETLIGAECLRSLVGLIDFSTDETDIRMDFMVLMEGTRTGLARILSGENAKTADIGDAPADAVSVTDLRIDPSAAVDEFERVIGDVSPAKAELQMTVTTDSGEVLSVRDDLVKALRAPLRIAVSVPPSNDPGAARAWVSLGHTGGQKMAVWVKYLSGFAPLQERAVNGSVVHDLPFNVTLAVLKDRFVVGTADAVDEMIEGRAGKTLRDQPEFRRALAQAPAEATIVSFQDTPRVMRASAAIGIDAGSAPMLFVQKPAVALVYYVSTMGIVGAAGAGARESIDTWARRLGPEISTLTTTPDGLRATTIMLKPATANP